MIPINLIPRTSRLWFIQHCPSPLYHNHPLTLSHTQFINYFQHSFPPFKPHFVIISLLAFAFKFCITRLLYMGVEIYFVSSFGLTVLLWKKENKQILKTRVLYDLIPNSHYIQYWTYPAILFKLIIESKI